MRRSKTDIAGAIRSVHKHIVDELAIRDNPDHPRLVLLVSDGKNDPLNENKDEFASILKEEQDIYDAISNLKSQANIQVAMFQLPVNRGPEENLEYVLQDKWKKILGEPYCLASPIARIAPVITEGIRHFKNVNSKIIKVSTKSSFTITPDDSLKGEIFWEATKLELITDSLLIGVEIDSLRWYPKQSNNPTPLYLTKAETKLFSQKISLRSDSEHSIPYAVALPCLSEVYYDANVEISFKLKPDSTLEYRKPSTTTRVF